MNYLLRGNNLSIAVFTLILLQSCYSARIRVKECDMPEPKPVASGKGYYRDKVCHEVKIKGNLGVTDGSFEQMVTCQCANGFYSVEYKVGLGNALLSGITLGKVRRGKFIYVCCKEEN